MENSLGKLPQQVNEKGMGKLCVEMFQLLSDGGIKILDEHKEFVSLERRFPENSSVEAKAHDKALLSIIVAGYNKKVNLLPIVAGYVNEENKSGRTPLHLAAKTGNTELVYIFLKAGANVNAEDEYKQTPLHLSAGKGHKEIVEILLKSGVNVNAEDEDNQTPLHLSAGNGHKEVVKVLLKAGANINAGNNYKQTPLHFSAQNGYKKVVEILLKAGANVEAKDYNKTTPLHCSAGNGNKEVVEMLLNAGASVEAEDNYKTTPLHCSAQKGFKEIVEMLLKARANVNVPDINKQTPLHLGAQNGYKDIVKVLLKAGANINAADQNKQTPLHISAKNQLVDISELLLRAGASVNERDIHRKSVLDYMDDEERIRHGFEPRTLFKLRNWKYSVTKSKKHVERSTSSKIKTEHTETISATFTGSDSGRYKESHTFPGLDMGTIPIKDSVNKKDDSDLKELSSIRQQVENHWSKFSLETTEEGCETSCSSEVKAALQAGRVVIPTTIKIKNIWHIKKIKKIKNYYEPGTNLNISHAENVAPGGQIFVQQNRKATDDDDDSSSEESSSSEDEGYVII